MALLRGQVAPHGGARLYGGRTRGGERLGRRLGDERPQQVGRHARTAQHLAAQFEEVVGEIAGEDPRQMHLPAQGRVGIEHRAAQAAGEGLHFAAQVGRGGLDEDRNLREVDLAPLREGLERIEDSPPRKAGQRVDRHAAGRMRHDGRGIDRQRRGYLRDGRIAHGDQIDVGTGQA